MSKLQKEERNNKFKGTSWLLNETKYNNKENASPQQIKKRIEQNIRSQNWKWKKNANNRFECYTKKIEQMVQSSFKEEDDGFNEFNFDSLRKTESNLNKKRTGLIKGSFIAKKIEYESKMLQMRRKEKQIHNQIGKMYKLKQISSICQQKKNFYDSRVDRYFEDQKAEMNRTINKIDAKCKRASDIYLCNL